MDALSDVLRVAHLTGGVFLHAEFFAPWCIATRVGPEHCAPGLGPVLGPASHLIPYHYIIEGEFQVRVDGEDGADLTVAATSFSRPRMADFSRFVTVAMARARG